MRRRHVDRGEAYFRLLRLQPEALQELRTMLFIGTTAFFREPALFQELEIKYLPALAQEGRLRVWSAGCSNGAELYSVALLLDAQGKLQGSRLVGTDCNPEALAQARLGVYTRRQVEKVRPDLLSRGFLPLEEGRYQIHPRLARQARFTEQDLLRDPFEEGWDLILCCNLAIYLTEEAQHQLFTKLVQALRPGGILFTGRTERLWPAEAFGVEALSNHFYRRRPLTG